MVLHIRKAFAWLEPGRLSEVLGDYYEILKYLSHRFSITYRVRMEQEFLQEDRIPGIIRDIIKHRFSLGPSLSPSTGEIALRSAWPSWSA